MTPEDALKTWDRAIEVIKAGDYLKNTFEYSRCNTVLRDLWIAHDKYNFFSTGTTETGYKTLCKCLKKRIREFECKTSPCAVDGEYKSVYAPWYTLEYPATPEEAFKYSNDLLFNIKVKAIKLHL